MAEWLRPGLWEVLMLSRGIEPGEVLIPKKNSYRTLRWFQSRPQFYMAGVSQFFWGQDGRVVKASFSVRCSC